MRAAFETIVLDVDGGRARAYRSFVDARTGAVLIRQNEVKQRGRGQRHRHVHRQHRRRRRGCGDPHPVAVSGAYSIGAFATANLPTDDIVLKLLGPGGSAVATAGHRHEPGGRRPTPSDGAKIADGTYKVVVCAFDDPTVPASAEQFDYTGGYAVNTTAGAPRDAAANPSWQFFEANPTTAGTDTRVIGCFRTADRLRPRASTARPRAARGTRSRRPACRRSPPRATPPAPRRRAPRR